MFFIKEFFVNFGIISFILDVYLVVYTLIHVY